MVPHSLYDSGIRTVAGQTNDVGLRYAGLLAASCSTDLQRAFCLNGSEEQLPRFTGS